MHSTAPLLVRPVSIERWCAAVRHRQTAMRTAQSSRTTQRSCATDGSEAHALATSVARFGLRYHVSNRERFLGHIVFWHSNPIGIVRQRAQLSGTKATLRKQDARVWPTQTSTAERMRCQSCNWPPVVSAQWRWKTSWRVVGCRWDRFAKSTVLEQRWNAQQTNKRPTFNFAMFGSQGHLKQFIKLSGKIDEIGNWKRIVKPERLIVVKTHQNHLWLNDRRLLLDCNWRL